MIGEDLDDDPPGRGRARASYLPVQVYPMFETALRAAAGRDRRRTTSDRVSELWSRFSAVAAGNPYAWIQDAKTPEEIRTPRAAQPDDRLPLPKYMNSNNDVDMAAAA